MGDQPVETFNVRVLLDENRPLKHVVQELSSLHDPARATRASLDPQEMMQTTIDRTLRAINADQGILTPFDQETADPHRVLLPVQDGEWVPFRSDQRFVSLLNTIGLET